MCPELPNNSAVLAFLDLFESNMELGGASIALSNTKAKYIGVTIATCEVVWLQKLL
jgi:hypothetical protein